MGPLHRVRVSSYSRAPSNLVKTFYSQLIDELIVQREARGWSQEHLDRELGVSDGQVAKWECFLRLPGAFMLVCWATALDVHISTAVRVLKDDPKK